MAQRERRIALGYAVALFLIPALDFVSVPTVAIGVLALGLAAVMYGRVHLRDGWALGDLALTLWVTLVGLTTIVTPAWGVPLLFLSGGIQLFRALGDLGMAINLALLAFVAFVTDASIWAIVLLLAVAVGKVFWLVRDHLENGSAPSITA